MSVRGTWYFNFQMGMSVLCGSKSIQCIYTNDLSRLLMPKTRYTRTWLHFRDVIAQTQSGRAIDAFLFIAKLADCRRQLFPIIPEHRDTRQ